MLSGSEVTTHQIICANSSGMHAVHSGTVDLVITSPPYPMIEMWDATFGAGDREVDRALRDGDGGRAFAAMHGQLDPVWAECHRVLAEGGMLCLNIGDATRSLGEDFRLYSNHSRILHRLLEIGFSALPDILWRKQTNAPNKFMGSGMLPAGAYVTLEHEYILILRKGPRRAFTTAAAKANRRHSALFWEERNLWYSDVWTDLKGTGQELTTPGLRRRSAAFPYELAHRLICMFSVRGDRVIDPFLGTGTTIFAAMANGRHSVGYELDGAFLPELEAAVSGLPEFARGHLDARVQRHRDFIAAREQSHGPLKYRNRNHDFAVMTRQETEISLHHVAAMEHRGEGVFAVEYEQQSLG